MILFFLFITKTAKIFLFSLVDQGEFGQHYNIGMLPYARNIK